MIILSKKKAYKRQLVRKDNTIDTEKKPEKWCC